MSASVELRRLGFSWPGADKPLLHDVSIHFPSGSATALIGPNGGGKTTFMELILGWRRPVSGQVLVDDRDVADLPGRERGRLMALVPQDERMPYAARVMDYVLLGRAPHNPPLVLPGPKDRRVAGDALERCGIGALAQRPLAKLSGGERRLVLIARALTQEPRLLILDEPTNHLDPANRERILQLLRTLSREGVSLMMSSHEPDMVDRLAHRVVLVRRGEALESGPPEHILDAGHLTRLYGVETRIAHVEGRRVILWGDDQ